MTMPAYNSFQLYKGDTLQFNLTLNTGSVSYNIPSTASFTGAVKEKNSSDVTANFDASVVSSASGQVLFTLSSDSSSLLDYDKNWIYDVQFKTEDGIVTTLLTGNIFVTDQVTP